MEKAEPGGAGLGVPTDLTLKDNPEGVGPGWIVVEKVIGMAPLIDEKSGVEIRCPAQALRKDVLERDLPNTYDAEPDKASVP